MDALQSYRQKLQTIAALDDCWFCDALAAARAGDDAARRRIAGSTLPHVLAAVERRCQGDDILDQAQDANAVIYEALAAFSGTTVAEFVLHVERLVNRRLDQVCAA